MDPSYALVADPDEERALVYAGLLREHGLSPLVVEDGEAAVGALAQRGAPAAAIIELALPRLDGFAVIGRLRKQATPSRAKVIAVSGFPSLRMAAADMRLTLGLGAVLAKAAGDESIRRVLKVLLSPFGGDASAEEPRPPSIAPGAAEARRVESMHAAGLEPEAQAAAPEDELQRLALGVAADFTAPIALVTLALESKLYFVARVGIEARETARYTSLCNEVIEAAAPLSVADAKAHPVYASNGLVRAGVIRGYASAPLVASDGQVWGTLCVIDSKRPLPLGRADLHKLCVRARRITMALERGRGRASAA